MLGGGVRGRLSDRLVVWLDRVVQLRHPERRRHARQACERLAERKKETPHTDRDDILTFMDYIEVDEGRTL